MDDIFPTLFSKTFFIVASQLAITAFTTHILFGLFVRGAKADGATIQSNMQGMSISNPDYAWLFSMPFFCTLIAVDLGLFLTLLFWGVHQPLPVSFTLFSVWSMITGIEMEYVFLNVDHGLGRRVLTLTAIILFATALIGTYAHVDFGFLQLPLFIALGVLLLVNIWQTIGPMDTIKQRLYACCGVIIFTLYLVLDFSTLAAKEKQGDQSWDEAMHLSIKIYLDIINLMLHILRAMGHGHH